MTFQAFRRIGFLITAELDPRSADPIQLCAHIADQPISLFCHPCADTSDNRSILHLRIAKDAGAAKDTQRQSRRRSADSSSGELSAQTERSSQYPGTEDHDKQDVEGPNRQRTLRRVHPLIKDPKVLVEETHSSVTPSYVNDAPCCSCHCCDRLLPRRRYVHDHNRGKSSTRLHRHP